MNRTSRLLLPVLALLLATSARGFGKVATGAGGVAGGGAGGERDAKEAAVHPPPPPLPLPPTFQHRPPHRLAHLGNLISQLEDAATAAATATPAPPLGSSPAHAPAPDHAPSPAHAPPTDSALLHHQHHLQEHLQHSLHQQLQHHLQHQQLHDVERDSSDYYEDDEDDYDLEEEYGDAEGDLDDADADAGDVLAPPWEEPQGHQPRGMSPVSQTKWDTMGTRSGVDELRRSRIGASKSLTAMPGYTEAVDHLLRVNRDGDCKVPKPRLVQVKHEYPHPSKIYLPRCTILHQCGDDTGCCNAESLTCVPRQAHRVDLFFYTSTVGTSGPSSLQRVERLSFYNHTECGCMDRNSELLSRDRAQALRKNSRGLFQAPFQPRSERAPTPLASCRCPSKYAVRPTSDGACICDCFDKHRECLRLKKGKEYFSTHDRQCIQKSECKVPTCEFGSYLRLAGRCPKKRERFEAWNQ